MTSCARDLPLHGSIHRKQLFRLFGISTLDDVALEREFVKSRVARQARDRL